MPVIDITPEMLKEFVNSGGHGIPDSGLVLALADLKEIFSNPKKPRKMHVMAYWIKEEQPDDMAEVWRRSKEDGYRPDVPAENQPKLAADEKAKIVQMATKSFLGTHLLISRGIPDYVAEGRAMRGLLTYYGKCQEREFREPAFGFDHAIARHWMFHLYDQDRAPLVRRDNGSWSRQSSGVCHSAIASYTKAFCRAGRKDRVAQIIELAYIADAMCTANFMGSLTENKIAGLKIGKNVLACALTNPNAFVL